MREDMLRHAAMKLRELQARIDSGQVKERFDLDHWWAKVDYLDNGEYMCGTAGCFVGWACHENWFKDFGQEIALKKRPLKHARNWDLMPAFNGLVCSNNSEVEEKLADMFGFSYSGTVWAIIYSENYATTTNDQITPVMVAERIEELIEVGEDEFCERY
jgi:hypothetical protein